MTMIGKILRQLRYMFKRRRSERDLEREIQFHIDMETQDRMDVGMSEQEARRTALADFGSMPQCHETVREAWGMRLWTDLRRDFQYAFRMIRRKPGFAVLTVLTLAVGIGANTAVFSVFDRTVLRPLPYSEPERLVHLWEIRTNQEFGQMEASYPDFVDWKKRNHTFEDFAGYDGTNFTLTGFGAPVRISAVRVTTNMLSILGVQPQLGRDFSADEEALDKSRVAIVTYAFWQRHFGGRADAIGQTLRLGGVPHTIVGVLPPDFQFLLDGATDMLVPLGPTPDQLERRSLHWLRAIGRFRPGVKAAEGEADLRGVAQQLEVEYAQTNKGTSIRLVPLHEQIVGNMKSMLLVVFGAAACMLCLAFLNLANLVVAQFTVREREMAIRNALGAGTMRLGRQLMAECLVMAAIGGIVSIAVAHWTLRIVLAVIPRTLINGLSAIAAGNIDGRVLAFNAALALLGGLFVGGVAILRLSRMSLKDVMNAGARSSAQQRLRAAFTVVEVALAATLLVCAVVMVQSVQRLMKVNPGFTASRLTSMHLSLPATQYPKGQDVSSFYKELQRRISEIPGVERAAVIDELPLTTDGGTVDVFVYGQPQPRPGEEHESVARSASPDYFETMGIPVVRGRTFTASDTSGAKRVVLLNETLARTLFGRTDPVGQRVVIAFNKSEWEIVGVVGDVRLADLDREVRPTLYTSGLQDPSRSSTLVFRTAADLDYLTSAVRAEVQRMDPELPVYAARSIEDTIGMTAGVATRKLVLYLVGAFSSIGALMAGIGLYGLMSSLVAQRSKEIGIRMALGAERGNVRRLILRQAMAMTWAGLFAGIVIAIASGRFIQSVVFGVTPSTPSVLLTVGVIVSAIAYVACYVPVRRATRTDPIVVLRHD